MTFYVVFAEEKCFRIQDKLAWGWKIIFTCNFECSNQNHLKNVIEIKSGSYEKKKQKYAKYVRGELDWGILIKSRSNRT